jgi:hypothetical protein
VYSDRSADGHYINSSIYFKIVHQQHYLFGTPHLKHYLFGTTQEQCYLFGILYQHYYLFRISCQQYHLFRIPDQKHPLFGKPYQQHLICWDTKSTAIFVWDATSAHTQRYLFGGTISTAISTAFLYFGPHQQPYLLLIRLINSIICLGYLINITCSGYNINNITYLGYNIKNNSVPDTPGSLFSYKFTRILQIRYVKILLQRENHSNSAVQNLYHTV